MLFPVVTLAALLFAQDAAPPAISAGTEPAAGLGARDIVGAYRLPPLKDQAGDKLYQSVQNLQVLTRARSLHLDAHSPTQAWQQAEATYAHAKSIAEALAFPTPFVFNGTRASQLNAILARKRTTDIEVGSPEILLDEPVRIVHDHTHLDLAGAALHLDAGTPAAFGAYFVRIEKVHDVRVTRGSFGAKAGAAETTVRWAMLIANSSDVAVLHTLVEGLAGGGILVTNSSNVVVWANTFHGLRAAPVLLHGETRRAVVAGNEITHNLGSSNWNAGIVLTDRNADLVQSPANLLLPDQYWVPVQPIPARMHVPEDNVLARNTIAGNAGSGIYSDGSALNVIVENRIEGNSKEGTCLDNGSTANLVAYNFYFANGKRWGKSDADLKRDFIFDYGRLADGSSSAKVPAISIDNAAYNQVVFNQVDHNYGGGIKMVRTAIFNLIGLNTITDNNEGQNDRFHFFGIELGAARADSPVPDLDFVPSRGNQIFGNIIRGSHYAGIFFAEGSEQNLIFDNTIFGATAWAMESVRPQANESLNNLTNLKLRNISAGLDPGLLQLGAGQFDAPPPRH